MLPEKEPERLGLSFVVPVLKPPGAIAKARDMITVISIPDLEHNHVPQRFSLFDRFYRFVYSFQGVSSGDELI